MAGKGLLNTRRLKRVLLVVVLSLVALFIHTQISNSGIHSLISISWLRKAGLQYHDYHEFLPDISQQPVNTNDLVEQLQDTTKQELLTEAALGEEELVWPQDVLDEQVVEIEGPGQDRWPHQSSFEMPKSALHQRQCDVVPSWFLHELAGKVAKANASTGLVIYHFRSGDLVSGDQNAEAPVGSEFCSVIFVPQEEPAPTPTGFRNQAIDGWGPDSLHLEIASADIRLIPEHPRFWDMSQATSSSTVFAVYMIAFALNHPGTYEVTGEVEFRNYDWVMEDVVDFVHGEQHPHDMIQDALQARSPALVITGAPVSRPTVQCYRDGYGDLHGRWYRASSFGAKGNQTALSPAAALAFADHNTTVDEWGWTFAPDACSLNFFSVSDIDQCLAGRTIQILGESNSRRLMKTLMSAGYWCTDVNDKTCECEDQREEGFFDFNFITLDPSRFKDTSIRDTPTSFGSNSKVWFDFAGGLINRKIWNPWFYFYDPMSSTDERTIMSTRMTEHGPFDLVHVSLLTWDIAGVRTADELLAALPDFKGRLLSAYPPGTRFITRLANNMCCGNQDHRTRFSAPRFAIFNEMWRRFWAQDEMKGAMLVDDASVLQGRRDAETAFFCPTTHLRASHVRLEAMMWLNAVCDGGSTADSGGGAARMRDWGYGDLEIYAALAEAHLAPTS